MQAMINASVCVDTFFLMSGLLVSYLLLRQLDGSKGRFNVPLFYIHRYLRWPELFIYFELINLKLLSFQIDSGLRLHFGLLCHSARLHFIRTQMEIGSLHERGLSIELVELFDLRQ